MSYSADKSYNITANGQTILPVPSNPAVNTKFLLCRIIIGKKGASSNVAEVYDSNATLGKRSDLSLFTLDTTDGVRSIEIGKVMNNGIFIDMNTGTAANLCVIYKEIF